MRFALLLTLQAAVFGLSAAVQIIRFNAHNVDDTSNIMCGSCSLRTAGCNVGEIVLPDASFIHNATGICSHDGVTVTGQCCFYMGIMEVAKPQATTARVTVAATKATAGTTAHPANTTVKATVAATVPATTAKPAATTQAPATTAKPTVASTAAPTTAKPTVASTAAPTTAKPTVPSTAAPTTAKPTVPSTAAPTTAKPTVPSTAAPTTAKPTVPSTAAPTTAKPTVPSTAAPTTAKPTTAAPTTTKAPVTTVAPTTTKAPVAPVGGWIGNADSHPFKCQKLTTTADYIECDGFSMNYNNQDLLLANGVVCSGWSPIYNSNIGGTWNADFLSVCNHVFAQIGNKKYDRVQANWGCSNTIQRFVFRNNAWDFPGDNGYTQTLRCYFAAAAAAPVAVPNNQPWAGSADGHSFKCSTISVTSTYLECDGLTMDNLQMANGIVCSGWSPIYNVAGSGGTWNIDLLSVCKRVFTQVTNKNYGSVSAYWGCGNTVNRFIYRSGAWGNVNDNGFTQNLRCYF